MLQGSTMFPSIIRCLSAYIALVHRLPSIAVVFVAATLTIAGPLTPTASAQTQTARLLPSDESDNGFACSLSLSGDTALIGAKYDHGRDYRSGSAYVFTLIDGVWIEQAKLLASDGEPWDYFGFSVSVDGDTAVVGALGDNELGDFSGSAYVFTRTAGVWTQQAKLLPSDGAAGDRFGFSVSVNADTAVIGAWGDDDNGDASGSAYVFTRTDGIWTQQAKLLPSDGATIDLFGCSVSLCGDSAIVGAYLNDDHGSAYVFARAGGVWTQQAKLLATDGTAVELFGASVALSGDTALIGAYFDDAIGFNAGSAYVFTRTDGVWTQQAKLLATDGMAGDGFGVSVSLSGDAAVIGAARDDANAVDSGSAYLFMRADGVWTQQSKLLASDGAQDERFGSSVSLNGNTALVGAYFEGEYEFGAGSAYVFDLTPCPADFNRDGRVTSDDYDAFASSFESAHPSADFNADNFVNGDDYDAFAASFESGC